MKESSSLNSISVSSTGRPLRRSAPRTSDAVAGHLHLVALHFQIVFQPESDGGFILHYQNAAHDCSSAGSTTVNVLPRPGVLSTRISPWCAAMMCLTMARPTPDPL